MNLDLDYTALELRVIAQVQAVRHSLPGCGCNGGRWRTLSIDEVRGQVADERARKLLRRPNNYRDHVYRAQWTHVDPDRMTCGIRHNGPDRGHGVCVFLHREVLKETNWSVEPIASEHFTTKHRVKP